MEKLAFIFTIGYHNALTVIFETENVYSDITKLLEYTLNDIIIPNEYYGLVIHEKEL